MKRGGVFFYKESFNKNITNVMYYSRLFIFIVYRSGNEKVRINAKEI